MSVPMYRALDTCKAQDIADCINAKAQRDPEAQFAIYVNQSRKVNLVSADWPELEERVAKRPFSLVGFYGAGISREELEEDFETAMFVFEANMEYRRMLHRCSRPKKRLEFLTGQEVMPGFMKIV